MEYQEVKEYKPFRVDYEPPQFGWWIALRVAWGLNPDHDTGRWFMHSLFYAVFALLIMPVAFLLDMATTPAVYFIIKAFDALFDI